MEKKIFVTPPDGIVRNVLFTPVGCEGRLSYVIAVCETEQKAEDKLNKILLHPIARIKKRFPLMEDKFLNDTSPSRFSIQRINRVRGPD